MWGPSVRLLIRNIYKYLSHLSIKKNERFTGSHYGDMPTMGIPNQKKTAPSDFLNLYGACLQAGTEDPKNEVVDNLPRYAG
jgi:hypothetical protein